MKEKIDYINNSFKDYFLSKKYVLINNIDISSGADNTVKFIGSAISVMKPLLLENNINCIGNIIVQRAIRTRALTRINISEKLEWSSYFDALGVLVPYNRLEFLVYDSIDFLIKKCNLQESDILIRISSRDKDLIDAIKKINYNVNLEIDSKDISYYNHKYGLDDYGIYGRNFNIAIKDKSDSLFKDIGNIIVIESNSQKYGVEFAIGANAIIMRKEGIPSSVAASSITDIIQLTDDRYYKFADCVAVVSHLAFENLEKYKNNAKMRSQIYLFHKYLRALKYWQDELKIDYNELLKIIENYLLLEYQKYDSTIIENNLKLIRN